MSYHKEFTENTVKSLEVLLNTSKNSDSFRRVQAVYFRAKYGYSPVKIAEMTGYSVGYVRNLHSLFLRDGEAIFDLGRPGGRKAAYMTIERETEFLRSFIKTGDAGGILEVSKIHKAHCESIGKTIALSTTYDLLHRHGWRKIMPRPRHPKADKGVQKLFKKMARDCHSGL